MCAHCFVDRPATRVGRTGETPTRVLGCTQASVSHGTARPQGVGTESQGMAMRHWHSRMQ
jgi:hypothetical protein